MHDITRAIPSLYWFFLRYLCVNFSLSRTDSIIWGLWFYCCTCSKYKTFVIVDVYRNLNGFRTILWSSVPLHKRCSCLRQSYLLSRKLHSSNCPSFNAASFIINFSCMCSIQIIPNSRSFASRQFFTQLSQQDIMPTFIYIHLNLTLYLHGRRK